MDKKDILPLVIVEVWTTPYDCGRKSSFCSKRKQVVRNSWDDKTDSFLAVDETETGIENRIPLWLFGFLY